MGKPYETELHGLAETYQWSLQTEVNTLSESVCTSYALPLIAVGSGGSLTTAYMAALLHQHGGRLSKAVTPLAFVSSGLSVSDLGVLIVSAGGRNPDILSAFRFAATAEPRQLIALCTRTNSPLASLSKEFEFSQLIDFDLPTGKDGFLATNSLLASITILTRAYEMVYSEGSDLPSCLPSTAEILEQLSPVVNPLLEKETWIILYDEWAFPAAIDAESKFTEAALGRVQIADYRNFAHGRHHWLAKRSRETGIVALITPKTREIAERTLNLLPNDVPLLKLATDRSGPAGTIELLYKMLHIVHLVGRFRGIDPGRPGVPTFGRRIYHLRALVEDAHGSRPRNMTDQEVMAISRKNKSMALPAMDIKVIEYWKGACRTYIERISKTWFGAIALDYDGTLCNTRNRYLGLSVETSRELIRLLENGIIIGIATGRGKSVNLDLQQVIPTKYWEQVLVGYYSGSIVARLGDSEYLDKPKPVSGLLRQIHDLLEKHPYFHCLARYELRSEQLSVEPIRLELMETIKRVLVDITSRAKLPGVHILESGHSIDIVAPGVSKLALVETCGRVAEQSGNPNNVLCIGDKGEWPGNDYYLLSTEYSLSVGTVSPDPLSCWNLSQPGHSSVQATRAYLKCVEPLDGKFHLNTHKLARIEL